MLSATELEALHSIIEELEEENNKLKEKMKQPEENNKPFLLVEGKKIEV